MNTTTNLQLASNDEILIYQSEDGTVKVDVLFQDETVWLTQEHMALLFGKGRSTITEHISNIFSEGELQEEVVCRKFRHTTQHGAIEGLSQTKEVKYYNLDVIISVGYRVKSRQGTMFRIWATQRLRDYMPGKFHIKWHWKKQKLNTTNSKTRSVRKNIWRASRNWQRILRD